jgi:hypothetical protein
MPIISQSEFAKLAGVTQASISAAVQKHTLVRADRRGDDSRDMERGPERGIDTEHPMSLAYLEKHKHSKAPSASGRGRPIVGGADPAMSADELEPDVDLATQGKRLQNQFLKKKIRREDLKIKTEERALIAFPVVERFVRAFDAALDETFHQFDQRCGATLREIARGNDDPAAFMGKLRTELDDAVRSCRDTALRELDRMKRTPGDA